LGKGAGDNPKTAENKNKAAVNVRALAVGAFEVRQMHGQDAIRHKRTGIPSFQMREQFKGALRLFKLHEYTKA